MAEIKVFCLHCGQHIQCDDGYRGVQINCPSCYQSFLIPQVHQAAPPAAPTLQIRRQRPDYVAEAKEWEASGGTTENDSDETPVLWNPALARGWALLLPPLGAFIHSRNAETLGRKDEAKTNTSWFYKFLFYEAVFLALQIAGAIPAILTKIDLLLYQFGFSLFMLVVILIWYFSVAGKQVLYVKENYGNNYTRKSWGIPLLVLFGYRIGVALICFAISFVLLANASKNVDLASIESQVMTSIEKKFAQSPETSSIKVQGISLAHKNGNKYSGLLTTLTDGKTEAVELDVTYDATGFKWQITPQKTNDGQSKTEAKHSAFQNHAVLGYSFYGVKIGDSYSSVEKVFNLEFQPKVSDSNMQKAVWLVSYQDQVATFYFLKGSLYQIEIMYNPEAVNKMGGHDAIHNKMVAEYGSEDDLDSSRKDYIKYTWRFQDANRGVLYVASLNDNTGFLVIANVDVAVEVGNKEK